MRTRNDLPFFLNQRGLTGIGVEVGVLRGEFAHTILRAWQGKKLYCVDAWRHLGNVTDINNGSNYEHFKNMGEAVNNLLMFNERAVVIRDLSTSAAKLFKNKSLDFIYIDAAHDYKNVMKDIKAWAPKVKAGGFIMGHDYTETTGQTVIEVKKAVDKYAASKGLTVLVTDETDYPTWYIQVPEKKARLIIKTGVELTLEKLREEQRV